MIPRRPPRLAEWLLVTLRRSADTVYLAGDLAEGFLKRADQDIGDARRWYWRQVWGAVWHRSSRSAYQPTRLRGVFADVMAARRILVRRPGPSVLAAGTIALAVAAVSTVLSLSWEVLYRPLSWPDADRLVQVWETREGSADVAGRQLTSVTLDAWRDQSSTIVEVAAYRPATFVVSGTEGAERVVGAEVSPTVFEMLGFRPMAGRTPLRTDQGGLVDADVDTVLVSARFAGRQFGSAQLAVGRVLPLDGRSRRIIGVIATAFAFPTPDTDLWLPLPEPASGDLELLTVLARLAPGATPEQAAAEAQARAQALPPLEGPVQSMMFGASGPVRVRAASLLDVSTANVRSALLASVAAVLLLLLTAVASIMGLQLARMSERQGELAVRAALGSGRARVVALLLSETLWLTLVGGGLGLLLTVWAVKALPTVLPTDFPRLADVTFNPMTVVIVAVTAMVTGGLAGLVPAWQASRFSLGLVGAESRVPGRGTRSVTGRPRRLFLMSQVAVAVVLLIGAGLVGRTLQELVQEDLGYAPANVLVARLIGVVDDGASRVSADSLQRGIERLKHLPGVTGVALATALPFQENSGAVRLGFSLPGRDGSGRQVPSPAVQNEVTPDYFDLVGLRVVQGRALEPADYGRATPALVVNETFARNYLGDRPLGPFALGGEVVGVVADTRDRGTAIPVEPHLFFLLNPNDGVSLARPAALFIRTSADVDRLTTMARAAIRGVDDRLGLADVTTVESTLSAMVDRPRLYAIVSASAALLALLIAAVGLFGVLWHGVRQRTREIGVRTALGATPGTIARRVVADGLGVALAGAALGVCVALVVVRFLASLLYKVTPHDTLVFLLAPGVLLAIATLACLIPARYAARVDPIHALRAD